MNERNEGSIKLKPQSRVCRICRNSEGNIPHEFREAMFGIGDRFDYVECGSCGTIQILEVPELSKYYPSDYLSFELDHFDPRHTLVRDFAIRSAAKYFVNGRNIIGRAAATWQPMLEGPFPRSLRERLLGLTIDSRILDVGCGSGRLLMTLRNFGFENVKGLDPFILEDLTYPNGVTVKKCDISDAEGKYDLVMFNHSLEHIFDPLSSLERAHELLEPNKYCLVRIPVVAKAWEIYGKDWVQLDPPRHLSLFTEKTFRSVAEKTGFTVAKVAYDSTAFQFWGSEQILRGLPVRDGWLSGPDYLHQAFGEKMDIWEQRAMELNSDQEGDQACFYLRRDDHINQ